MTTSVAYKTLHVATPPSVEYITEPVSVIVSPNGCDQGQAVASELNVMEMTEVEYAHLQQILQSHMEEQSAGQDRAGEVKLNPTSAESANSCGASPPTPVSQLNGSNSLATGAQYQLSASNNNSNGGTDDVQEIKLALYSESVSAADVEPRTPARCGEVPSSLKCTMEATRNRGNHRRMSLGSRPNPPARVRLEKRFNCSPCDLTRKQETQAAVLNTFLSLLHQSTDMPGIAMHSEPEKWHRAERTATVENSCGGSPLGSTHGQGLSHYSHLLEGGKHPEVIATKNFSSIYSSDKSAESAVRSSCIIYAINEKRAGNTENDVLEKAVKRAKMRSSRALQVQDPNIIQNLENWKPAYTRAACKPGRRAGLTVMTSESRARHNSKERERRRRIRMCCDELKLLVPFCNPETDKATTLQWTTAFLKYISEIYGDSLKQDFQNTFCGKTGVRVRPNCAEDAAECENSTSQE